MEPQTNYGDELPPGATLCGGQYTIERYLNSGGFGVTYLAADSLGRRVVIKECFPSAMCCRSGQTVRLRSRGSGDEFGAILELFEKEARALAGLQHPYIVGVHQYFRDNDTAYMAMDFVEGKTLLEIIENEPNRFDERDIKRLLIQLLQAVGYIHSHDILHRDISPDNILIDQDNLPVLIDFGAAREGATRVSRVLSKVLTVKDGYSPQEFYLQGSDQSYSSDLYALAATFYHVVGRSAPPSSHTRMAAVARDMADPYAPLGEIRGYDDHFVAAINTCLSMFPQDRLPSAEAWRDQIDIERRKQMLLAQAEQDQALEDIVRQLVAEFRKDFTPVTKAEPKPQTQATATQKTAKRETKIQVNIAPPVPKTSMQTTSDPQAEPDAAIAEPDTEADGGDLSWTDLDDDDAPLEDTQRIEAAADPVVPIMPRRPSNAHTPVRESGPPQAPDSGWLGKFGRRKSARKGSQTAEGGTS